MGSNWTWLLIDLVRMETLAPSGLYLKGIKHCSHFVTFYVLAPCWKMVSSRLLTEGGCWLQNPCGKRISPPPASGTPSIRQATVWWRRWRWLHDPITPPRRAGGQVLIIHQPTCFYWVTLDFWDVPPPPLSHEGNEFTVKNYFGCNDCLFTHQPFSFSFFFFLFQPLTAAAHFS